MLLEASLQDGLPRRAVTRAPLRANVISAGMVGMRWWRRRRTRALGVPRLRGCRAASSAAQTLCIHRLRPQMK